MRQFKDLFFLTLCILSGVVLATISHSWLDFSPTRTEIYEHIKYKMSPPMMENFVFKNFLETNKPCVENFKDMTSSPLEQYESTKKPPQLFEKSYIIFGFFVLILKQISKRKSFFCFIGTLFILMTIKTVTGYEIYCNSVIGPGTSRVWDSTMWDIVIDDNDNVYAVGWEDASSTTNGIKRRNGWIAKFNKNSTIWTRQNVCSGNQFYYAVDLDNSDGVVVAGYGEKDCIVDNPDSIFVKKIDEAGAIVWEWYNTGLSNYIVPFGIKTISSGGYVVVGSASNGNPFILKLLASRSLLWAITVTNDIGFVAVDVTSDGSIIAVAGTHYSYEYEYNSYFLFTSSTYAFNGIAPCTYMKFTSSGGLSYTKTTQGANYCDNIRVLSDNSFLIMGWNYNSGISNSWLNKISSSGNSVWEISIDTPKNDYILDANQMENGDIICAADKFNIALLTIIISSDGEYIDTITYTYVNNYRTYYVHSGAVKSNGLLAITGHLLDSETYTKYPCPPGTHSIRILDCECIPCEPGYYQSGIERDSCLECPVMNYQNEAGKKSCEQCPLTQYQDETVQIECKPCLDYCLLCTNGITCDRCLYPYYLHYIPSIPHECLAICPVQYFNNINPQGIYVCSGKLI